MNKILALLCVIGGVLWGVKPIYDMLFNGRRMNTGYTPSDPTDYIKFIFPLLCLAGLVVMKSLYQKQVRNSVIILYVAVILTGLFHFFEIYFHDSDLPFGFIFLFFGTVGLIIGSLTMFIQLRKRASRFLVWSVFLIFLNNFLIIILSLLTEVLPTEFTDPVLASLMISIGFIWALVGVAILKDEI